MVMRSSRQNKKTNVREWSKGDSRKKKTERERLDSRRKKKSKLIKYCEKEN